MSVLWEIKCHRIAILCTYYPKNPKCDMLYFSTCMLLVRMDYLKNTIDLKLQLKENNYLFYHDCEGLYGNVIF